MYDSTLLVFSLHISKPWMSIAVSYNVQWQIQTQVLTICHVLTFPLFFSWVRGSKQQCWGVVTFKRHIAMVFVVHSDAMRCWFASVSGRFRRLILDKIVTVFARDLHAWHTLWIVSSAKWPVSELVCSETSSRPIRLPLSHAYYLLAYFGHYVLPISVSCTP